MYSIECKEKFNYLLLWRYKTVFLVVLLKIHIFHHLEPMDEYNVNWSHFLRHNFNQSQEIGNQHIITHFSSNNYLILYSSSIYPEISEIRRHFSVGNILKII